MTVTAGRLEWEVGIKESDKNRILREAEEFGRKMDQALNRRNSGLTGLSRLGRDAQQTENRVAALAGRFNELNAKLRLNLIDTQKYSTGLKTLEGELRTLGRQTDLTAAEYRQLAAVTAQVQRGQATLGGSTAEVVARVRSLVKEVTDLRNTWQRTGQATQETKNRLNELQLEMAELAQELRNADGGWRRYNQQISQLSVSGRSAEATIAGIEGRMSRLGLASQVNLATQQALVGQMYRFGPAGQAMAGTLGIVGGGMGAVSAATLGVAGGLVAAGVAATALTSKGIPEVKAFQAALNVLIASGEDLTLLGLQDTLRDIQDAAGRAGDEFARSDMATTLAEIVKAGVDLRSATDLMVPGMQLAVLTGQSLNETTSLLLGNLRQFGLETTEAVRVADALAAADLRAASGVQQLSEGLAVVGPVAAAAGLSIEDTLGILIELDNKGMNPAQEGATGLRSALSALLDPTAEARETLAELGVELEDSEGKARPLKDVLFDLAEAFDGNAEAAQAAATIFDTRALTTILNVTEASLEHADALNQATGALEKYADQVTREDLGRAQERLATAWRDLAGTFATGFADDLVFVLDRLTAFLEFFDNFLRTHQETPWWARGTAWNQINTITGGGIFGRAERPAEAPAPGPSGFTTGGTMDDMDGDGKKDTPAAVEESLDSLIAKARELKAALDAATTPAAWVAAQRNVDAFVSSSEAAAEAWRAVTAIMGRTGRAPTVTRAAAPERTVDDVFSDLAEAGTDAERRAAAFGDTLDASLESAQTRAGLVGRAITELIEDFDMDPASAEVQFLVDRLRALGDEIARLKRETGSPPTINDAATVAAAGADFGLAGAPVTGRSESDLLADVEAFRQAEEAKTQAYIRNHERRVDELIALEQGLDQWRVDQQAAREASQQAHVDELLAIEGAYYDFLIQQDVERRQRAAAEEEARQAAIAEARARNNQRVLNELMAQEQAYYAWLAEQEQNRADLEARRQRIASMEALRRIQASHAGVAEQLAAAEEEELRRSRQLQAAYEARARTLGSLNDATRRGTEAMEASGSETERLQRRIQNLITLGFDPASEAVQELVRRINELQLRAALEELRSKGLKNLSDFARAVLEANGILPTTTESVESLSDKLRNLAGLTGNDIASGLADIIDGIKQIGEAAGDTEEIVAGLTQALEGATRLVEALGSGDGLGIARGLVGSLGAGLSALPGMPAGLGGLATGVFDLGASIVQAISDAFTGDSQAATAIRESLTPAVASAFSTGILAALRGQQNWQEALEGNVKEAFLGALIQAFVNSAIVGTVLQPLILEFSKLLGRGQYDAARAFLASELPAALNAAMSAVDAFVGAIPAGLLPGTGDAGSTTPLAVSTPTITQLPSALVSSVSAPSWINEMNLGAGRFANATEVFEQVVNDLMERGIAVRVTGAAGASTAAVAA